MAVIMAEICSSLCCSVCLPLITRRVEHKIKACQLEFILFHFVRYYKIVGSSENYSSILSKLREEGIDFEPDNGSELLPNTTVEVCLLAFACAISFVFLPSPFVFIV